MPTHQTWTCSVLEANLDSAMGTQNVSANLGLLSSVDGWVQNVYLLPLSGSRADLIHLQYREGGSCKGLFLRLYNGFFSHMLAYYFQRVHYNILTVLILENVPCSNINLSYHNNKETTGIYMYIDSLWGLLDLHLTREVREVEGVQVPGLFYTDV